MKIETHFPAYIDWGLLFSIQPPFYPSEAEKKGATPAQASPTPDQTLCGLFFS